jgi:hypothetical protein
MTTEQELTLMGAMEMLDAIKPLGKAKRLFRMAGHDDMADDLAKIISALSPFAQAAANRAKA